MAYLSLKIVRSFAFAFAIAMFFAACAPKVGKPGHARIAADTVMSPDGIHIAYEAHGEGATALVFVHGWSCDRTYWKAQLRSLSRDFNVVAVDLAGHGESGLGRDAWTIEAFGGDVAAVANKLGLKRIVLVGHSMGGDVIAEAARQLPGRVQGLVWIDTYKQLGTYRTPDERKAMLAPFRADFVETTRTFVRSMFPPSASPSLVEHVATDMSSAPPAVALGALESAIGFDRKMPLALQALNLPVVAINPEHPSTDTASMQRHGVEVVLMPGVGHFAQLEDPERFNALLKKIVDKMTQ